MANPFHWLQEPNEEIEQKHSRQLQLAEFVTTWQEEKIQELKDEIRVLNQKMLVKKLQIKNLKHDK